MITEDFVSFEVAKLLKEKGFESDDCHTAYDSEGEFFWHGDYSKERKGIMDAPTLQMALKWLRKTHNLFVFPFPQMNTNKFWVEIYQLSNNQEWVNLYCESIDLQDYPLYEEACEAAIKYCLENLI